MAIQLFVLEEKLHEYCI